MATTPMPSESKAQLQTDAKIESHAFWGRKRVVEIPSAIPSAPRGPQPFPKMMYHADGRMQIAQDAGEEKEATKNGWKDSPDLLHRELLQADGRGTSGKRLATAGSDEPEEISTEKTWEAPKEKTKEAK